LYNITNDSAVCVIFLKYNKQKLNNRVKSSLNNISLKIRTNSRDLNIKQENTRCCFSD